MMTFQGKGVCGAIAIGNAFVFGRRDVQVRQTHVDNVLREVKRLEVAKEQATRELQEIYEKTVGEVGEADAQIFEAQRMLLEDLDYNDFIRSIIEKRAVNAEYATMQAADHFAAVFEAMEDAYMQARATDVRDVSDRLIKCLREAGQGRHLEEAGQGRHLEEAGQGSRLEEAGKNGCLEAEQDGENISEKRIVCAYDLAPSETVSLDKERVLAFVTAQGSVNSHTAILARNRNVPAIVGVGEEFLKVVRNGMQVIVDGFTGEVILEPDEETLNRMLKKRREDQQEKLLLQELKGKENVTLDGTRIQILANIDGVGDVGSVLANDADGIGLFRSEFLYLESEDYPSEEEQFQAYRKVLESMAGRKVIIRTLDIGADKQIDYFKLDREENPALGLRAIRLCLTRPEILKTQLRALYRASAYGRLGILFPMITSVPEVEKIMEICEEVKAQLRGSGIPFDEKAEIGIMIETPAAAVISDRLAPLVNFFSVGTNDLIQYTLAMDRKNAKLEPFCDTHHEAVLRLIQMATENAHRHGAWIGICGELAADQSLTETFLRMGIDELSVAAPFVLPLRDKVRKLKLD